MANGLKVVIPGDCFSSCMACCNSYYNEKRILEVTCPILIIHGTDDHTVPFRNSIDLLMKYRQKIFPTERMNVIFDEEGKH